ncbi:MAG: hypothetical protein HDS64_00340 [Bacteroidales bacterium]|nr:hypothetical protein [Bacteroidales bacterium]
MNIRSFIPTVLSLLGISKFHEEQGKQQLLESQRAQLSRMGFSERFIQTFEKGLNEEDGEAPDQPSAVNAAMAATLAQTSSQLLQANEDLAALKTSSAATAAQLAAEKAKVAELTERVKTLAELAEPDPGANAGKAGGEALAADIMNADQLGGRQGEMFAMDRPYNQRARAALIESATGQTMMVASARGMDYKSLKDDLGAFYRQSWKERVQSLLAVLRSCESYWPVESGYQDLATLVNVWLGEFSQADNTVNSDFEKVEKGEYTFGHETLRMYSVMFVHKFKNMKEIERLWIGSLNREGSKTIKWSLIEYLLVETAKKLHNEREQRRINGVRKNPVPNVPGTAMGAADGIYEFIRKRVDGYTDFTPDGGLTGKTVYQIKPFALPAVTMGNIGDVVYQGTSMIPSHYRDSGNLVLYMPSHLVPWYHKFNELKYGQNQDYQPNEMYVHEFPGVRIQPVANADNHLRLIWTFDGNIKCYEQRAGEMLDFELEQQDWSVKVWSNWKESIQAEAVGRKFTSPADMDGSEQFIWVNDEDYSKDYFVPMEKDSQPSALLHSSIVSVANSSVLAITDIDDAEVGRVITLKCGAGDDEGIKIEKSGNFSEISAAWTPGKGDIIRLMKRQDGKFIELGRGAAVKSSLMFEPDATEPSVAGALEFMTGANTKATAITALQDAIPGIVYTIHGSGTANASTIASGGGFSLTKAITLNEGAWIKLVADDAGKLHEVARG